MFLFQIFSGILFAVGTYFVLADVMRIPYLKSSAAVMNLTKSQKEETTFLDVWLSDLADKLAGLLRLNEFHRAELEANLRAAQIELTPERYTADAIVRALLVAVLISLLGIIHPIMLLMALLAALVVYRNELHKTEARIKKNREEIEYELPRLVFHIEKSLRHSRDVIAMLEGYSLVAGSALQSELEITVADMRSGNYETAITRFELRTGSSQVSDVCRGLIAVLRGDNTESYWSMLAAKFSEIQRSQLRARAKKIPPKVHRLSMFLLFAFMAEYMVAIGYQMVTSLSSMFA